MCIYNVYVHVLCGLTNHCVFCVEAEDLSLAVDEAIHLLLCHVLSDGYHVQEVVMAVVGKDRGWGIDQVNQHLGET